jgi:hypothetical protein
MFSSITFVIMPFLRHSIVHLRRIGEVQSSVGEGSGEVKEFKPSLSFSIF